MQFQNRITELQTRRLVLKNLGLPALMTKYDQALKDWTFEDYLLSKQARTFYMPVQITLNGTTGPRVGYSVPVSHDLIIVGATHNAPSATVLMSIQDTMRQQTLSNIPVPPTALASDTSNNIYRYLPWPVPFYLVDNSRLEVSLTDPTGGISQVVTVVFQCIWTADIVGNNANDAKLDAAVERSLNDPTLMQPYVLGMNVPFTSTASEQVTAQTPEDSEPMLLLGIQQSLTSKSVATTSGPKMLLRDSSTNYSFSQGALKTANSQTFVWAQGNFVTEPEQYILFPYPYLLRPNAQIIGEFTNGLAGSEAAAGQVLFLARRLRLSLAGMLG